MSKTARKFIGILVIMFMITPLTWPVYADEALPEDQETAAVQNEAVQSELLKASEVHETPAPAEHEAAEVPAAAESVETEAAEASSAAEPVEPEVAEVPATAQSAEPETSETPSAVESVEPEAAEAPAAVEAAKPEAEEATAPAEPAEPEAETPAAAEPIEPEAEIPAAAGPAESEAAEPEAEEAPAAAEPEQHVEDPVSTASETAASVKKAGSAVRKSVSATAVANADPESKAERNITISGTSLDGSEDSSGNGWTYEKESGRIVLRDYTASADITSDGTGVEIVSTGFNRIGTLSCDGDINVIGTGILLIDKVELAEDCSFNLLPLREYYGEDGGSVAVFLKQEDDSYKLVNGQVKGIIDEKLVLPEDIKLVLPADSLLELQALSFHVKTDEDGNKTIILDPSAYSEEELKSFGIEYYDGYLYTGDLTLDNGATIRNFNLGDVVVAGITVVGNLINDGLISGGTVTVAKKTSGSGGLYSGSGTIENAFITLKTGQTTSINIKDSTLNLLKGDYTIEQLGIKGSSKLFYNGNPEIKTIKGTSGSSLDIHTLGLDDHSMEDNLKITGSIDGTAVLLKSGITELKAGLRFLNGATISNATYGGPVFNYSELKTVSDGTEGFVFLGPDDVTVPDQDSIPVVSLYLHKDVGYNWDITLNENMDEGQEYTMLDDYDAAMHYGRQISYNDLIYTYFPEGLDFLEDGQSIIFEVLRLKDGKLSMTILGDEYYYEQTTDSEGVFLIRLVYLDPSENQHGGTSAASTRASQTGSGNIGGNSRSIFTGTGITRTSSVDPVDSDPDPVKPDPVDPNPVKPDPVDPDPVKPDPVDPDPVKPDPVDPDPIKPNPVNPDPIKPDPVNSDPDPVKPDDHDPYKTAKEYSVAAFTAADDAFVLYINELHFNEDGSENTDKAPYYILTAYINGAQVNKLDIPVKVEMDYKLPEEFKDKPLYAVFENEDETSNEMLKAFKAEYDEESEKLTFETMQTGEFIITPLVFDGEKFSPEFYDELEKTELAKLFIRHLEEKKNDAEL